MKINKLDHGGFRITDPHVPGADAESDSLSSVFRIAYLPGISVIPMIQHGGESARLLVGPDELVHEGMIIGRAEGKGSSHIHAPVSGRVLKIVRYRMYDGRECDAVVLRMQGAFTLLGKRRETWAAHTISPYELKRVILEKGLVDMDGDGAPLNELVSLYRSKGSVILFNAVFDDPWQAAGLFLARQYPDLMISGLSLLARATSIEKIYCAICPEEKDLAKALVEHALARDLPFELVYCERCYPMSNRQELESIMVKTGRVKAPLKKGAGGGLFILGPATLFAVHEALTHNHPLLERYVSVGGSAVKYPSILKIRLGTRIGDAIAECGGFIEEPGRIILNSMIKGFSADDLDTPITKTLSGIIVEGASSSSRKRTAPCIGCGECRDVCPRRLDPELLHKMVLRGLSQEAHDEGLADCTGCNACAVVCPSHISLVALWSGSMNSGGSNE